MKTVNKRIRNLQNFSILPLVIHFHHPHSNTRIMIRNLLRHGNRASLRFAAATARPAQVRSFASPVPFPKSAAATGGAQHLETNVRSETNRLEKTAERFWEHVNVKKASDDSGYLVQLDKSAIKTPSGLPLLVPAPKPALAQLIAHEWRVLPSLKIKPHSLLLTSTAARAVDLSQDFEGPKGEAVREDIIEALLPYLDTDTLLIFSPVKDCEGTLRPAQEETYRPIIKAAEEFWTRTAGASAEPVKLTWLDTENCISGNSQNAATKKVVADWIRSLDTWQLSALERATMTAKSLIIGMNIATLQMSVEKASEAARLETIHQTGIWGEVEDTHDVDFHDMERSLACAYLIASDC